MVRSIPVLEGIGEALVTAPRLPELNDYTIVEADGDERDADLSIPFAEITSPTGSSREEDASTAFSRFVQDQEGNDIGRIFEFTYQMDVELTVWDVQTRVNTLSDIVAMGENVETALYRYDSQSRDDLLPSADGGTISAVTDFFVGDGYPTADLGTTPSLRGWRQELSCRYRDRLNTVEEYGPGYYVDSIVGPADGDFYPASDDEDHEIEYIAPE